MARDRRHTWSALGKELQAATTYIYIYGGGVNLKCCCSLCCGSCSGPCAHEVWLVFSTHTLQPCPTPYTIACWPLHSTLRIVESMTVSDLRAAVLAKSKAKISPECYGICAEKPSGIVELPSATPAFQVRLSFQTSDIPKKSQPLSLPPLAFLFLSRALSPPTHP